MRRFRGLRPGSRLFVVHAAAVLVLIALYVVIPVLTPPEAGFNFGIVYVALPLLALGLPWSVPAFVVDPYDDASLLVMELLLLGPAVLNVVLHGLVLYGARRVRARRELVRQ